MAGAIGLLALCLVILIGLRAQAAASDDHGSGSQVGQRILAATLLLATLAVITGRLIAVVTLKDASASARWSYVRAALSGLAERPVLGFGPGSSSWLIAEKLENADRSLVAHQLVTDLHSMALELLFETGIAGTLALAVVVGLTLAHGRAQTRTMLVPLLVASAIAGWFDVAALHFAGVMAVGATLATRNDPWEKAGIRVPGVLFAVAVVGLVPAVTAHFDYDRALAAAERPAASLRLLERAHARDPQMPLYRFRQALLESAVGRAAEHALSAAEGARGLHPLWLVAGSKLAVAGRGEEAARALVAACDLDPRDPLAPWLLARSAPQSPVGGDRVARALMAEPALLAASPSDGYHGTLATAVGRLEHETALPVGWRAALVSAWREVELHEPSGGLRLLTLGLDGETETSLSMYAFRRRPWPAQLAAVELGRAPEAEMPPVYDIASPAAIDAVELLAPGCRLSGADGFADR